MSLLFDWVYFLVAFVGGIIGGLLYYAIKDRRNKE